ncbi:MAG: hypothetical protein UY76_C0066G0002 [Candidatus Uhrbacteria bacterium GW2011_GWA2_52_8d]|uniref:Uncharacterized protein n=1 Tax=Candidatus Uhrbacteria bacterium GW2011_GWA2_52_8d TaxID=1618979 RepID=A0A0G2AF00_9BACT|nr:MAG: hypothetical protein UY76_C0066G0002 [Candidatus Uhrbacteria bacterium GW2011_GWA2_52_8d]
MSAEQRKSEHRFEVGEKPEPLSQFTNWVSKYGQRFDQPRDESYGESRYTPNDFLDQVSALFGEGDWYYPDEVVPIKVQQMREQLGTTLSHGKVKMTQTNTYSITYQVTPDWLMWKLDRRANLSFVSGNAFDMIFSQDGDLVHVGVGNGYSVRSNPIWIERDLMWKKLDKIIDEVILRDDFSLETIKDMNVDAQQIIFQEHQDVVKKIEQRYIEVTARLFGWLHAITEFRKRTLGWDQGALTKEILSGASRDLQQRLFPHRKKSIREVDEMMGQELLKIDKIKADIHRQLVGFRYLTEYGIGRERVTAELDIHMRAANKDSIQIHGDIVGAWSQEFTTTDVAEGPSFSLILGSGITMTSSSDYSDPAREPLYTSFVSSGRSRKQDILLADEIIALVAERYPSLRGFNNLKIRGSTHEIFTGNEVVFERSEISKVSEKIGISPEAIAQVICAIAKACIERQVTNQGSSH